MRIGSSGWVGEEGPEWAQALPGGGVHITPNHELGSPLPRPPRGWADGGIIGGNLSVDNLLRMLTQYAQAPSAMPGQTPEEPQAQQPMDMMGGMGGLLKSAVTPFGILDVAKQGGTPGMVAGGGMGMLGMAPQMMAGNTDLVKKLTKYIFG